MASGHEESDARGERIEAFLRSAYGNRVLRVCGALIAASLWLTMALGDPSFLLILVAAVPGVWWWRRSQARDAAREEVL